MGVELFSHCTTPMQHRLLSKIKPYRYNTYTFDKSSRDRELPSSANADVYTIYIEHEPKRANNKYLTYQHYI